MGITALSSSSLLLPSRLASGRPHHRDDPEKSRLRGPASALLPIPYLCSRKGKREASPDPGPLSSQQLPTGSIFQDGKPFRLTSYPPPQCLDGQTGHPGCLPPYSYPAIPSQISCFHSRTKTSFLQSSSLWSSSRSVSLHENAPISSIHPQGTGNKYPCLPRRLDNLGKFSSTPLKSCLLNHLPSFKTRLSYKLRKVRSNPHSKHPVAGYHLEFCSRHRLSAKGIPRKSPRCSLLPDLRSVLHKEAVGKDCWPCSLYLPGPSPSQAAFLPLSQATTVLRQTERHALSAASSSQISCSGLGQLRHPPGVVSSPLTSFHPNPLDRCLSSRLGSPILRRSDSLRPMVSDRSSLAYQCSRDSSCREGSDSITESSPLYSNLNGQPLYSCGDKSPGLQVPQPSPPGSPPPQASSIPGTPIIRSLRTRMSKCVRRRTFSRQASGDRVGTLSGGVSPHLPLPGCSRGRPIRIPPQHQAPSVCLSFQSPQGSGNRCLYSQLESMEPDLPVSTPQPPVSSSLETESLRGGGYLSGSLAPNSPLVPSPSISLTPTSSLHPSPPARPRTPIRLVRKLDRASFLQASFRKSFSHPTSKLLIASYRPSSRRQAEVAWKAFQSWLPRSTTSITKSLVLDFLTSLFNVRRLSPRTIISYRASLALPLRVAFGIDVSDPEFSLLAKAQFNIRPPVPKRIPEWSLSTALSQLKVPPFSVLPLSEENSLLKTLFLVCLASGNRVSEIAALDRSSIRFRMGRAEIPVRAGFLFKNQTLTRSPPNIIFPTLPEDPSLCPVQALKSYISLTSCKDHKGRVFLNPSSSSPLKPNNISFWLCKAIKALVPNALARAHDLRKFAHSLAWTRGVPMDEILRNAFWSSSNVFVSKYLSEVSVTTACVAGRSSGRY